MHLSTKEAATKLKGSGLELSSQQVAELARSGSFPHAERSDNKWLIPEEDINAYIKFRQGRKRQQLVITASTITLAITLLTLISIVKDGLDLVATYVSSSPIAAQATPITTAFPSLDAISIPTRISLGKFGVVVAGFGFEQPNGTIGEAKLADDVSDIVYASIREIQEIDMVQDWRSLSVGRILAQDHMEREKQAAALADLLGVDVVIYGTVSKDNLFLTIQPELYVTPNTFTIMEPEIGGAINFVESIRFIHDSDDQVLAAASDLQQYLLDIRIIIRGLSNYYNGNYPIAIQEFEKIISLNTNDAGVLKILAGNAATRDHNLSLAMTLYQEALSGQPDYGRALIGKGNVYFQLARNSIGQPGEIDNCPKTDSSELAITTTVSNSFQFKESNDLQDSPSCYGPFGSNITDTQQLAVTAIDCYNQAKLLANTQNSTDLEVKSALGLAQVQLWLSMAGASLWSDAERQIMQLLDIYNTSSSTKQARIRLMAAHAYAWLGLLTQMSKPQTPENLQGAIDSYRNAVELLESDVNIEYNHCSLSLYKKQINVLDILLYNRTKQNTEKTKIK